MVVIFEKIANVKAPLRGTTGSAGWDFYIPEGQDFVLKPDESIIIPSGIKLKIPDGYCGVFLNKSSIAASGIIIGAQVIDSDYRGEVHIHLINIGKGKVLLKAGQKIAQMLFIPVPAVSMVEGQVRPDTERNAGGFGSTGKF